VESDEMRVKQTCS